VNSVQYSPMAARRRTPGNAVESNELIRRTGGRTVISGIGAVLAICLASAQARPAAPRPPVAHALSTTAIAARVRDAMVTIGTRGKDSKEIAQGSGVLLREDGVIVTNWHVLAGADEASVTLASGERFDRVTFLDGDSATDIALIKIPGYKLKTAETTAN